MKMTRKKIYEYQFKAFDEIVEKGYTCGVKGKKAWEQWHKHTHGINSVSFSKGEGLVEKAVLEFREVQRNELPKKYHFTVPF